MKFLMVAAATLIVLTLFAIFVGKVIKKGNAEPIENNDFQLAIEKLERVANGN